MTSLCCPLREQKPSALISRIQIVRWRADVAATRGAKWERAALTASSTSLRWSCHPMLCTLQKENRCKALMKSGEIQAGFTGPAGIGRSGPPISGWHTASEAAAAATTYPELIADVETRRNGLAPPRRHLSDIRLDRGEGRAHQTSSMAAAVADGSVCGSEETLSGRARSRTGRQAGGPALPQVSVTYERPPAIRYDRKPPES